MRPTWNEYFMLWAKLIASRSTCSSRPTGCILVLDNQVLSTGYNGAPSGFPHCIEQPDAVDGTKYCYRRASGAPEEDKYNYCVSSHAEANAVARAAKKGISMEGATAYVTLAPCHVCLKLLVGAGVKKIYYEHLYESNDPDRDQFWRSMAQEYGIEVYEQITICDQAMWFVNDILKAPTSGRRLK